MKKHIICFGDSNTYGLNGDRCKRFDESERWTALLQESLGNDYLIYEEGLNGRTTSFQDPMFEYRAGTDYIIPCIISHYPVDLLIIMLGTNDTKTRLNATTDDITNGLAKVVNMAKSVEEENWANEKPNILIVTPKYIDKRYENTECGKSFGPGCHEKSLELSEKYKKLAKELGCHYMDANDYILSDNNKTDYIHLSKEGHKELAIAMEKKIKEIL